MTSCIIIGSGGALAPALATRFGRSGFHIGLVSRTSSALKAQSDTLQAQGIHADWHVADAADASALRTAIDSLQATCGPCEVLIYNAAVLRPGEPLTLDATLLQREMAVNAVGALVAAQTIAPGMSERGVGTILFTGGGLALEPYPEWTSLAMGKAALRSLAFSLHKTLAPKGVHVAVIAICGIVEPGGPFDPRTIAEAYWRLATDGSGVRERELIIQPPGTDMYYNDPQRRHRDTTPTAR